jgi:DinB family protein
MDPLERSLDLLGRTPLVLRAFLAGLEPEWLRADEGAETYSPHEVLGHLIHGEDTDWVVRTEHLLEHGERVPFVPFERDAMRERFAAATSDELLDLFEEKRTANLARVRELELGPADLARRGLHPDLGTVTLGQLLSTWVVHDLTHLAQIARVLAKARASEIGPWRVYFRLLQGR